MSEWESIANDSGPALMEARETYLIQASSASRAWNKMCLQDVAQDVSEDVKQDAMNVQRMHAIVWHAPAHSKSFSSEGASIQIY